MVFSQDRHQDVLDLCLVQFEPDSADYINVRRPPHSLGQTFNSLCKLWQQCVKVNVLFWVCIWGLCHTRVMWRWRVSAFHCHNMQSYTPGLIITHVNWKSNSFRTCRENHSLVKNKNIHICWMSCQLQTGVSRGKCSSLPPAGENSLYIKSIFLSLSHLFQKRQFLPWRGTKGGAGTKSRLANRNAETAIG